MKSNLIDECQNNKITWDKWAKIYVVKDQVFISICYGMSFIRNLQNQSFQSRLNQCAISQVNTPQDKTLDKILKIIGKGILFMLNRWKTIRYSEKPFIL